MIAPVKRYAVALAGVIVMATAFAWNAWAADETVPNDANIGAGLLFMTGIAIMIVGLTLVWSRRNRQPNPPSPQQN